MIKLLNDEQNYKKITFVCTILTLSSQSLDINQFAYTVFAV